jgi:hypothetical protein
VLRQKVNQRTTAAEAIRNFLALMNWKRREMMQIQTLLKSNRTLEASATKQPYRRTEFVS